MPAHFDEDEVEPTIAEMMHDSIEKTRLGLPRNYEDNRKKID